MMEEKKFTEKDESTKNERQTAKYQFDKKQEPLGSEAKQIKAAEIN